MGCERCDWDEGDPREELERVRQELDEALADAADLRSRFDYELHMADQRAKNARAHAIRDVVTLLRTLPDQPMAVGMIADWIQKTCS